MRKLALPLALLLAESTDDQVAFMCCCADGGEVVVVPLKNPFLFALSAPSLLVVATAGFAKPLLQT